jgi:exopolysaccharide biosynthesis predicted pyruvyltransferase EpsI
MPNEPTTNGAHPDPAADFARYKAEIDALLDQHIPAGRPVALLQFPYDGNVGNHMMWVATTDYLKDRGIPVGYAAHANNYRARDMRRAIGDGPILFLGGVTISRLWPHHASNKREVAEQFPDNPIISLPSTVLFVDDADGKTAADMFGRHRNCVLMTRDPVSEGQARKVFPDNVRIMTVPDLALRLPLQPRRGAPHIDILWLARDDQEAAGFKPPPGVHVFDWPYVREGMRRAYYALRVSGVLSKLRLSPLGSPAAPVLNAQIAAAYRLASVDILRRGNEILDEGRVLVTDRMHPHILAALRGQDVVVLPDKFGKNRAVYDNYTKRFPSVFFASSPEEGLSIARERARA